MTGCHVRRLQAQADIKLMKSFNDPRTVSKNVTGECVILGLINTMKECLLPLAVSAETLRSQHTADYSDS